MNQTTTSQKYSIQARIIRKDGKIDDLGTIVGGNFIQKVVSYIKIKLANIKNKWRQ